MKEEKWIPVFFAVAACSWMPHWACHYYRLETGSTFVVGSWNFSMADSVVSMALYSALVLLNLMAVSLPGVRFASALSSGLLHLTLGTLHIYRLVHPFRFEVIGHPWSMAASFREVLIVLPFGIVCLVMAMVVKRLKT